MRRSASAIGGVIGWKAGERAKREKAQDGRAVWLVLAGTPLGLKKLPQRNEVSRKNFETQRSTNKYAWRDAVGGKGRKEIAT